MAAAGYMTELDTEAIWNTTFVTARFDLINVRIAEQLNFWINHDATEQVTDVSVTPILEQISEEVLLELIEASKSYRTTDAWNFIQANVARISRKILTNYRELLKEIRLTLTKQFLYTETDRYSYTEGQQGLIKRTT